MLGDYPYQVYAAAHSFSKEIASMNDVDTVAAVLKFKSGALAIIDTSRDAKYGYDQRIEVCMISIYMYLPTPASSRSGVQRPIRLHLEPHNMVPQLCHIS